MDRRTVLDSPHSSRRSFFSRVLGFTVGAITARLGISSSLAVARSGPLLTPVYVPPGFRLVSTYFGRVDGFKGGADEVAYWFVSKDRAAFSRPLSISHAARPERPLFGTQNHAGAPVNLAMNSGATLKGRYQDGIWWLNEDGSITWNNTDVHSITFALDGRTVGVRGSRLAGISYEELQKVAQSVA